MPNEPLPGPPLSRQPLAERSRRSLVIWTLSALLAFAVIAASAIAFGYMALLLLPVLLAAGLAYLLLRRFPVRNPAFDPADRWTGRYADGQPEGRALRREHERDVLLDQARRFREHTRADQLDSERRADETYDPRRDGGPPPNVPFP